MKISHMIATVALMAPSFVADAASSHTHCKDFKTHPERTKCCHAAFHGAHASDLDKKNLEWCQLQHNIGNDYLAPNMIEDKPEHVHQDLHHDLLVHPED